MRLPSTPAEQFVPVALQASVFGKTGAKAGNLLGSEEEPRAVKGQITHEPKQQRAFVPANLARFAEPIKPQKTFLRDFQRILIASDSRSRRRARSRAAEE